MKNLFFILIFSACVLSAQAKDYIVTDYSVSMDSTQLNTAAIQSVIDLAEKEGGGTITQLYTLMYQKSKFSNS